jgi:hypothetical protein
MTQPTIDTTEAAPKPDDKSLFARFVGVLFAPRETFALVAARPRWFGMLALVLIVSAVVTGGFLLTAVGQQAWIDAAEKAGGGGAQQLEVLQKMAPYVAYGMMGGILIVSPLIMLVTTGILFVIFTVGMGGNATFKQAFAVVVYSQAVGLVGAALKLPLNYLTRSMTASTNLGVFFPMLDDTSFLARLAGMVDLFLVWWVVVLAIGFGVLYKRRTGPIAVTFFVLYALIAVAIAAFQAARS